MNDASSMAAVRRADHWLPSRHCCTVTPLAKESECSEDTLGLAVVIGHHVHKLRKQQGLSLETLAQRSRVSRAMLSQIERGRSTPTIAVLWKIAHALATPVSALLREDQEDQVWRLPAASGKWHFSQDGRFCSRALFAGDSPRRMEFYEWRLQRDGVEVAAPHSPDALENLVVSHGEIEIVLAENRYPLVAGDAIQLAADVVRIYRNIGSSEAVLYRVMSYA